MRDLETIFSADWLQFWFSCFRVRWKPSSLHQFYCMQWGECLNTESAKFISMNMGPNPTQRSSFNVLHHCLVCLVSALVLGLSVVIECVFHVLPQKSFLGIPCDLYTMTWPVVISSLFLYLPYSVAWKDHYKHNTVCAHSYFFFFFSWEVDRVL